MFTNASFLITGGAGSFGRQCLAVLLRDHQPARVVVFSRDEAKHHDMRVSGFTDERIRYFIGDVRDRDRLRRAMRDIDFVIHAAALKQVPAAEYNPIEAIKSNINGAVNVIEAALDCGVKRVIALSTDKATASLNLYGATKLVAEKLFVQANSYSGRDGPCFACTRYGNVMGSRGSILLLFREQRTSGRVTITDPRMTRFAITLEHGVQFVLTCLTRMQGGEVFIPKLPSFRVVDLARVMAPECEQEVIGIRPGEKLHESLLSMDEARQAIDMGDHYAILPAHPWWNERAGCRQGKPLPEDWSYSSNTNDWWLSEKDLKEIADACV